MDNDVNIENDDKQNLNIEKENINDNKGMGENDY